VNSGAQLTPPDEATISAYLANSLNEAKAQEFESYCLEHPDFARFVEDEQALKAGMRELEPSRRLPSMAVKFSPRWGWPLAAAAAAAVVLLGVGFGLKTTGQKSRFIVYGSVSDLPQTLLAAKQVQVTLLTLRQNESEPVVTAPAGSAIEFRILPPQANPGSEFSVQMRSVQPSGKPFTVEGLRPGSDGFLRIYGSAKQMAGHTWSLKVLSSDASVGADNALEFHVRVVTPGVPGG
jgi:hypothetical protein